MAGLAGTVTPETSGNLLIIITGNMSNGTAEDGSQVQIRYGTGTAPGNGVAATGTAVGEPKNCGTATTAGAAGYVTPFTCMAYVTGLSLGTAYWLDLGYASITGGTTTLTNIDVMAIEL
jgi:hypothetical protein